MTDMHTSSLLSPSRLERGSTDLQSSKCVCIAGTKSGGLFNYRSISKMENMCEATFFRNRVRRPAGSQATHVIGLANSRSLP